MKLFLKKQAYQINYGKQKGFSILTLLFIAVGVIGVLGAVMALSRSSTGTSDAQRPYASAILAQGNTITSAFQIMEGRGIAASNITFDLTAESGLYTVGTGAASPQTPPPQAFSKTGAATPVWIYKGANIKFPLVGNGASGDYAFILSDVSQTTCQNINNNLTGNNTTIPSSGKSLADFHDAITYSQGIPYVTDTKAVDLTGANDMKGMMQGCVSTDGGSKYVFFVIAEPQ